MNAVFPSEDEGTPDVGSLCSITGDDDSSDDSVLDDQDESGKNAATEPKCLSAKRLDPETVKNDTSFIYFF